METVLKDDPEEDQFEERQKWHRLFDSVRSQLEGNAELDARLLASTADSFLDALGQERLKALTPSYERGPHLAEVIAKTFNQLTVLMAEGLDALAALRRFSDDSSVRILTIHKCKGLEFDTVYMLGIENEMFWGAIEEERQIFFVGISRAKRRLVLTCSKRRETPTGARRWEEARTPQYEFMSYASSAMV
jgi:superfamily I DNA/RNA helicase